MLTELDVFLSVLWKSFSVKSYSQSFSIFSSLKVIHKLISATIESFVAATITNQLVIIVFVIFVFIQTEHRYARDLSKNIINIVNSIVSINFRSTRAFTSVERDIKTIFFVEFNQYSIEWSLSSDSFVTVVRKFHAITDQYRQTRIYFNFLSITNTSFDSNDSSNKFKNKFLIQQSISFIIDRKSLLITFRRLNSFFLSSDVFRSDRFNNSKSHVRLSIASSYSFIIDRSRFNISTKQFSVFADIQSTETRQINVSKNKNDEVFFTNVIFTNLFDSKSTFVQTKKIFRSNMNSSFSVSVEIKSIFWNDLLIMTQVFNIIRSSSIDFNFDAVVIVVVDVDKSVVDLSKNIEYFDSKYEDSFERNFIIVIFDRHIFYRDVFIFIDRLKNLKKNFFDSKIKKYVAECMKNDILKWQFCELNSLKKKLLKYVTVDQWCETLIQRFKKRDATILKKLQNSFFIFVDVHFDKTSRVYVQNILRHFRIADYNFIYHQLLNAWSDLELKMRMQISEFIFDIQLNIFLDLLNSKITIWTKMIVKRAENNFDTNNVDKANRSINKQNRRQNNFQQSDVYDSQFSQNFWFFSNYTLYQFQNSAYQNQKYQYQFFEERQQQQFFSVVSSAMLSSRQSLQIIFENAFDSKIQNQTSRQQQKNSANVEKFNNRNKKRVYVVDEFDEEQFQSVENFQNEQKNQLDCYVNQ